MKVSMLALLWILPVALSCGQGLSEGNLAAGQPIELRVEVRDATRSLASVFLQPSGGNSGSDVTFDNNGIGSPVVKFSYPAGLATLTFQIRFTSTSDPVTCTSVSGVNPFGHYLTAMTITINSSTQCVGAATLYSSF